MRALCFTSCSMPSSPPMSDQIESLAFVAPDDTAFKAAAAGADWAKSFYQILTNQPGKDAWPIEFEPMVRRLNCSMMRWSAVVVSVVWLYEYPLM